MTTTYTTGRESYWPYIMRQWMIPAVLYCFIIIYDKLLDNNAVNIPDAFEWIGGALLLYRLVDLASKKKNYKIEIDEANKTITQYYQGLLTSQGEKIYTLSKVRLYIKTRGASPASAMNVRALILYKDHREAFQLDIKKDGFTPQTLKEISETMEKLGVPVSV